MGNAKTRVLGIDPGLVHTGWAVIEYAGNSLRAVACGTISPNVKLPTAERLKKIYDELLIVIETHHPETAAIEESFVAQNSATALKLGMARAVALLVPSSRGIPAVEYNAKLVKKSVVGTGTADKNQIYLMVKRLLPGIEIGSEHAADALAIAICHSHHRETAIKLRPKTA